MVAMMGQAQEEEKKQKRDSLWPLREEASLVLFSSVSSQVPNSPVLLLLSLDGHENIFLNKLFYRPIEYDSVSQNQKNLA